MVSQERIEHAVATHPDPVVTVRDILDVLDVEASDTHVRHKMEVLAAAGTLNRKDVGARAVSWWHTDRVSGPRDDPAEHPDQTDLSDQDQFEAPRDATGGPDTDVELVATIDLPGEGQKAISRQQALLAVLNLLDHQGEMRAGEIRDTVYPDEPAAYEHAHSWWKNCVSPALSELADRDRVELRDRSRGIWSSTQPEN